MFCNHCGQELAQGTRFCTCCGADQTSEPTAPVQTFQPSAQPDQQPRAVGTGSTPKNPKGKYLLFGAGGTAVGALLLAVILLIAGVFSSAGGNAGNAIEGPGFATPEEAAEAYLTGLRNQDIDAMISAFAVESYVDHYDFEARVEHMGIYDISYDLPFPNTDQYTRKLNIETRRIRIMGQFLNHFMVYHAKDEINDGYPIQLNDPEEISNFIKDFEHDLEDYVFQDLTITTVLSLDQSVDRSPVELAEDFLKDMPEDLLEDMPKDWLEYTFESYMNEANQEILGEREKSHGVDIEDIASVLIVFEADGNSWLFYPQAIRYNGRWYLEEFQGNLAILMGMSALGGMTPIGTDYFE